MVGSPFLKWGPMSAAFASKLTEITYFLIPLAIVIAGIIFWENSQKKKEPEAEQKPK